MSILMRPHLKTWIQPLLTGILFSICSGLAYGEDYPKWDLLNKVPDSGEYIGYKIAYRGLFTGYTWQNLAAMVLHNKSRTEELNGQAVCQSVMRLSTENFPFAEAFHPVRYEWNAENNPDLSFTRLVKYIDSGKSDNYHVVWMDWPNETIRVYRKRKLKSVEQTTQLSFLGDQWAAEPDQVWEGDGAESLPPFLQEYPKVDNGTRSFLIHDKTVRNVGEEAALEPLGVLAVMRSHDYKSQPDFNIDITVDEDVKQHTVRYQGEEVLQIDGVSLPVIRLRVANSAKNQADKEGWMDVWLSNDDRRLPVRYQVDAPVGKMRVQITEESLRYNMDFNGPRNCYIQAGKEAVATQSVPPR
jgi:hypothetical protein